MSRHRKREDIPDRWLNYKAVGRRLCGTRFIAFKVPLKQALTSQLHPSEVFGHRELLDALEQDRQELGVIVDLTNTTRYYGPQDLPESLMFVKIFTAGHQVPSDATILSFKRVVWRFLRDNSDNDKLIGVHCTHGLNRTGYLICRYLIDVDGMEPKEAVKLFNLARGHSIERKNYLEDLHRGRKRSNDGIEECEQEPVRGGAESEERPRRGSPYGRQNPRPNNGLLPTPLLPTPRFSHVGGGPPHDPYRYGPERGDSQRWRAPPRENSRSRPPQMWSQPPQGRHRRRGPPPPHLPRYSPDWNDRTNY